MKKTFSFFSFYFVIFTTALFFSGVLLTGCQSNKQTTTNTSNEKAAIDEKYAVPASKGPTSLPSVQGPSDGPPTEEDSSPSDPYPQATVPQAITEKENIRLTLPLKNS